MLRKSALLSAAMVLVLGLAACKHDPAIIDYPTPMSNLKQAHLIEELNLSVSFSGSCSVFFS